MIEWALAWGWASMIIALGGSLGLILTVADDDVGAPIAILWVLGIGYFVATGVLCFVVAHTLTAMVAAAGG
jgi:hypothetical protein